MKSVMLPMVVLTALVTLFLAISTGRGAEEAKKPALTVVWATSSNGDAKSTSPSSSSSGALRAALSLREARNMGITVQSVAQAVRELNEDGAIDAHSTDAEVSAQVAQKLFKQNTAAWGDPKTVNWDAILAFIEKLLPLIMALLGL